jgi:hypothetical protein
MPERDTVGVPLQHYREHPGSGVLFMCRGCQFSFSVPLERVIARLEARGLGGAQTGVVEVARYAGQRCRRCGVLHWESRPAFRMGR